MELTYSSTGSLGVLVVTGLRDKSQQHFGFQVNKQCVGCSFEAVTVNVRFLVKGSHGH